MIVWCQKCETVPLDTATHERLVCMPCGVGEAFDSYELYREYNDRLDYPERHVLGPYEYREFFTDSPAWTLSSISAEIEKEWWRKYNSDFWQTVLYGPNYDSHIIRSEN